MKPGYYWIRYTDYYDDEHETTVAEYNEEGDWWLCGSDVPVRSTQVRVLSDRIEEPS